MQTASAVECSRFPQRLQFRAPDGLPSAIERAAEKRHTSPSEWMRQTMLRGLEAEGIDLRSGQVIERNALGAGD